jgi:hypothetical protein
VTGPTVIAVDWSGAKRTNRSSGLWLSVLRRDLPPESRALASREEAIDYLLACEPPFIAGFDFSFGLPEWFAIEQGCATVDDVWRRATRDGEHWLAPTAPFWKQKCGVPPEKRFRRCEARYPRAKSVFQLVGNGQVGAGSVRGMPLLGRLREAGIAVWPFDAAGTRTVFEIYPSALRKHSPHHDVGPWQNEHERDAVVSARVMWDQRETFAALGAANDPTTRLEGDIWFPTASP